VEHLKRYLEESAFSSTYSRQMRFIAGPRQAGKTTISKNKLAKHNCDQFYYNWDRLEIRRRYRESADILAPDLIDYPKNKPLWACFDEIHKQSKWKNILKDVFDTYEPRLQQN